MSRVVGAWGMQGREQTPARLRLFCFHHAGGGASSFRSWLGKVGADVDVVPIQLPGRENRLKEPPVRRMEALVDGLVPALSPLFDLPFAFFGHSMGSLIAFELARHLRRTDQTLPVFLFVSSRRAPQLPNPNPPIHQLADTAFLEVLQRLNGTPDAVLQHDELMRLILPAMRADYELVETYEYVPEEPLACPIAVFGGMDDPSATREDLLAWRQQTAAGFNLHLYPGGHFYLQEQRAALLREIAEDLSPFVNRVTSESANP